MPGKPNSTGTERRRFAWAPADAAGSGWAWTGITAGTGSVVFIAVAAHLLALIMLAAAGILTMAATVWLCRRRAALTSADRYLPRYSNWIWTAITLQGLLIVPAGLYIPTQVDSIAYLAGAGGTALFLPEHYARDCVYSYCRVVTDGVLTTGGGGDTDTRWPGKVPLGKPITTRVPVWVWGNGWTLISGTSRAVADLLNGLICDLLAAFVILNIRPVFRNKRQLRQARPTGSPEDQDQDQDQDLPSGGHETDARRMSPYPYSNGMYFS